MTALVSSDNPAALALLRRLVGRLDVRYSGSELSVRAALAGPAQSSASRR